MSNHSYSSFFGVFLARVTVVAMADGGKTPASDEDHRWEALREAQSVLERKLDDLSASFQLFVNEMRRELRNLRYSGIIPPATIPEDPEILTGLGDSAGENQVQRTPRTDRQVKPYFHESDEEHHLHRRAFRSNSYYDVEPIQTNQQVRRQHPYDGQHSKFLGLKWGSSILDSERPIRRIRQQCSLMSAANARFASSSSSCGFPFLQFNKEDLKDPTSSEQPCLLNELKLASSGLQIDENRDSIIFSSNVSPFLGQSIETSQKILEQLDDFTPREKKSNMKLIAMDESLSKLTADMLNGGALRSMENVDTSQSISMDIICTSDFRSAMDTQKVRGSQSENLGKSHENSPSNLDVPRVNFAMDARPSSADITNTIPATVPSQRKPAFQMTAPEDLLDLDDEEDLVDVSVQSTMNMIKKESKFIETETPISGMSVPEQPLLSSFRSMSVSSSIPFSEIDKACDVSHDSAKESSLRFLVTTNSSGHSSPSLTPTVSFRSYDKLLSRSKPDQSPYRMIQMEGSNLLSGWNHEAEGLHKSLGSSSSVSNFLFGSSPSTRFSLGLKTTVSGVSSFGFGSSSRSAFSGGSFFLDNGDGDRSSRKFVKFRNDKIRRK